MTPFEKTKDRLARQEIQESWANRIAITGETYIGFCNKYGLNNSVISRYVNGHNLAGWDWIKRVEKALESEGV